MDHYEEAESVDDCLRKCKSTDGCQWFSYITDSRVCFLFKDCPVLDESFEGCTTGQVDCEISNKNTEEYREDHKVVPLFANKKTFLIIAEIYI
jgi:hypothetical protein